jgi:predicted nucleic acid-binding protein
VRHLLDGNVVVALVVEDHVHHAAAQRWFGSGRDFATTPITQGTLLRFLLRVEVPATDALAVLEGLCARDDHEFWPDHLAYADVDLRGVIGHRQVTDAYLTAIARTKFDEGLAALHPDAVMLLAA